MRESMAAPKFPGRRFPATALTARREWPIGHFSMDLMRHAAATRLGQSESNRWGVGASRAPETTGVEVKRSAVIPAAYRNPWASSQPRSRK